MGVRAQGRLELVQFHALEGIYLLKNIKSKNEAALKKRRASAFHREGRRSVGPVGIDPWQRFTKSYKGASFRLTPESDERGYPGFLPLGTMGRFMKTPIATGRAALRVLCLLTASFAGNFFAARADASVPSVTVAASNPTAAIDGSSKGLLVFTRTQSVLAPLTVNFTLGGTAVKWTDYYRMPQGDMPVSVTIPAGVASTSLPITARANSTGANPESAVVTLAPSSSYTVGAASSATISIVPALPAIAVVATNPTAAINGSSTGLLTFSTNRVTTGPIVVNFTLGGTAVKWTDYYRLPQGDMPVSVTIPAGTTPRSPSRSRPRATAPAPTRKPPFSPTLRAPPTRWARRRRRPSRSSPGRRPSRWRRRSRRPPSAGRRRGS